MKCHVCKQEIPEENIRASVAAHDEELLDLVIECEECETVHNAFINFKSFTLV